jgi:hypothetical protein
VLPVDTLLQFKKGETTLLESLPKGEIPSHPGVGYVKSHPIFLDPLEQLEEEELLRSRRGLLEDRLGL